MNTGVHVSGYQVARHAATDFGDSPIGQFGQRTVSIAGSRPPHPGLREMFSGIVRKLASFNFMAPASERLARRADNEVRQAVRQTSEKLGYMLGIAANRTGYPMQVVCEALAKEFKALDQVAGRALNGPAGTDQRAGERDGLVRERLTLHLRNMSAEQMRDLSSGLDALRREGKEDLAPLLTLVGEARQTVAQEFGHRARVAVDQVLKQPPPTTPQGMVTFAAQVGKASDLLRQEYAFQTGAITDKVKATPQSVRLQAHVDGVFAKLPASMQGLGLSALGPKDLHQFNRATTTCGMKNASIAVRQEVSARHLAQARPVAHGLWTAAQAGARTLAAAASTAPRSASDARISDDFRRDLTRSKYFIEVDGQRQPLMNPTIDLSSLDPTQLDTQVRAAVDKLLAYLDGDRAKLDLVASQMNQSLLADLTFKDGMPNDDSPLRLNGQPVAAGGSTEYVQFTLRKQADGSLGIRSELSRQGIGDVMRWEPVDGMPEPVPVRYTVDPERSHLQITAETRIANGQVEMTQAPLAYATLAGAIRAQP